MQQNLGTQGNQLSFPSEHTEGKVLSNMPCLYVCLTTIYNHINTVVDAQGNPFQACARDHMAALFGGARVSDMATHQSKMVPA